MQCLCVDSYEASCFWNFKTESICLLADDLDDFLEFEAESFHKKVLIFLAGFDDDLMTRVEEIDLLVFPSSDELFHEEIDDIWSLPLVLAAILLNL